LAVRSATYSVPVAASRARPFGTWNVAYAPKPFADPATEPASVVTWFVAASRRRTRTLPVSVQNKLPFMSATMKAGPERYATTASPSAKAAVCELTPTTVAIVPFRSTRRMRFAVQSTTQKPPFPRGSTARPRGPASVPTPRGPSAGGFVVTPSTPAATETEPRWQRSTVPRVKSDSRIVCRTSAAAEGEKSYDGSTSTPVSAAESAATAYVEIAPLGDAMRSLPGSVNHVLPAASPAAAKFAPIEPSVPTPKGPSSDVEAAPSPAKRAMAPAGDTPRSIVVPVSTTRRKPDALSASAEGLASCPTPAGPFVAPEAPVPAKLDTFHTVPADELYASKASPVAAHVAGHAHAAAGAAPPAHQ
jgi:hypothetical protein